MHCAGVIAVAVYGLYGAATNKWDIHIKVEASGAFDAFWETIAFIVNGIIFFYSGVACINFIVRSAAAATRMHKGCARCCGSSSVQGKQHCPLLCKSPAQLVFGHITCTRCADIQVQVSSTDTNWAVEA